MLSLEQLTAPIKLLESRTGPAARALCWSTHALFVMVVGFSRVAICFRYQIQNGFDLLLSDRYDGFIQLAIVQHWYNVLHGSSNWLETNYFYPLGTLGYNDGYFIYGIVYTWWRFIGFDVFVSNEFVNITLKLVGFFAFYGSARRILSLRSGWAVLGASLFTISNNLFIRSNHAQLLGVCIAPLMALMLSQVFVALGGRRRWLLLWWGASAVLLYASWLMSTFYMAWYFAFYCTLLALSWMVAAPPEDRHRLFASLRRHFLPILALAALTVVANFPFIVTYLPTARETGQHPWDAVVIHSPSVLDVFDVGTGNYLFGNLVSRLNHLIRPGFPSYSERTTGFPPLLLLLFAAGAIQSIREFARKDRGELTIIRALAMACLFSWALALHFGPFTGWYFVYKYVPGGMAARVIARYQIFLALPVIGIALEFLSRQSARLSMPVLCLISVLLVAEELNANAPLGIDRPLELARLASVSSPPANCRAFYSLSDRGNPYAGPAVDALYANNADAMFIAEMIGLPTLNGFSTFVPRDWYLVYPARSDYQSRVDAFAKSHNVRGLCGLNLRTLKWQQGAR